MAEEDEALKNHALVADEEEVPIEYALMTKSSSSSDEEMGLPEFVDDTVTDYTRPTPSIDVSKSPMIKFVKESGCPNATKVNNTENARKSTVKYAEIPKIPTVGSKVPAAKPTVAADKENKGKAVKASARWIWKPKQNSSGQGLNFNGVSVTFKKYQYIDTQGRLKSDSGCSRNMTGNISYLSEYEPFNRGYVSFGHERGKITVDESMLWHRRLGHLNFKTMNKLVRSNLVKGLPSKSFENDHSCVVYLKEKQHKASFKSKNMSGNISYLFEYETFNRGYVSFGHERGKITEIENLKDLNVKIIKSDNEGEFRNKEMDKFCSKKGNSANGLNRDPVVNMCLNFLHGSDSEQWTHEFMHIYLVSASVCMDR
nr:putative ribonuclease H-like domain-containing protein [Tanacetum cinerariifolium]